MRIILFSTSCFWEIGYLVSYQFCELWGLKLREGEIGKFISNGNLCSHQNTYVASEEIIYSFFSFFFQIYFGIVHIWPIYHSLDQEIWFMVIFFLSKRAEFCSKYEFCFVKLSYILSQFLLLWTELWKCTPIILIENCDQAICFGLLILFLYVTPHKAWLSESLFLS